MSEAKERAEEAVGRLADLAREAMAMSERADPAPWSYDERVGWLGGNGLQLQRHEANSAWSIHARHALPLLANAVLRLMPFVRHEHQCASWYPVSIGDEHGNETVYPPCDCGLDAAIGGIGGE